MGDGFVRGCRAKAGLAAAPPEGCGVHGRPSAPGAGEMKTCFVPCSWHLPSSALSPSAPLPGPPGLPFYHRCNPCARGSNKKAPKYALKHKRPPSCPRGGGCCHAALVAGASLSAFCPFFALFAPSTRRDEGACGREGAHGGGGRRALSTSPGLLFNLRRRTGRSQLYFCPIFTIMITIPPRSVLAPFGAKWGRTLQGGFSERRVQEFLPARLCASLPRPSASHSDGAWHPGTAHFLALS